MFRTFLTIFRRWHYSLLALVVAWATYSLVMWLPNLGVIMTVWKSNVSSWGDRLAIMWHLYGALFTNFTWLTGGYVVLLSVLFGIQIALLAYYIQSRRVTSQRLWQLEFTSIGALVAGSLGIGCAACGSLVLTSLLATFGGAALVALLPLQGAEFGVLGVVLLTYTCVRLLQAIAAPNVCPTK